PGRAAGVGRGQGRAGRGRRPVDRADAAGDPVALMTEWDVEIRPRLTPRFAYGAAALVLAVHVAVGALLKVGSTGVIFRTADQVAIALLGVVFAVLILVLSQPRLRIGPRGIAVRNAFTYKLIPWSDVVDVSFPVG